MEKTAKVTSRKNIDSTLLKARTEYSAAKADRDAAMAEFDAIQKRLEKANARFSNAKSSLLDLSEKARLMDLTGASALRDRGKELNYIVDGKEYHIDAQDVNDIRMVPWKEYKRTKNEPKEELEPEDQEPESEESDPLEELLMGAADDGEDEDEDSKKKAFKDLVNLKKQDDDPLAQLEYRTVLAEFKDFARGFNLNKRALEYPDWTDEDFTNLVLEAERA